MSKGPLVEVSDLRVVFPVGQRGLLGNAREQLAAVDGVSFSVASGETFALVGESGCGKSSTGHALLRLLPSIGRVTVEGAVRFRGVDVLQLPADEVRKLRREMQIVFQDPYTSLDPRMTVARTVAEPLRTHGLAAGKQLDIRIAGLLERVGLSREFASRYPHELSGGQRQRVGVARAIAVEPAFIVCDEPTSALDVSIQAQIVNLLQELQEDLGIAYLFITHNLAVVRHLATRVGVMYLGKIVETGACAAIFAEPLHPYTAALLEAAPEPDPDLEARRKHRPLRGEAPSALRPPNGCRFHPRCPLATAVCEQVAPPLEDVGGRHVACHHWREMAFSGQAVESGGGRVG